MMRLELVYEAQVFHRCFQSPFNKSQSRQKSPMSSPRDTSKRRPAAWSLEAYRPTVRAMHWHDGKAMFNQSSRGGIAR